MGKAIDADTLKAIHAFLARVEKSFDVSSAALFGSRARVDHRPDSDVDVAVFLKGPPSQFAKTKLEMADIAYEILLEYGLLIEPLPVWDDERHDAQSYSNPSLLANIEREGIAL